MWRTSVTGSHQPNKNNYTRNSKPYVSQHRKPILTIDVVDAAEGENQVQQGAPFFFFLTELDKRVFTETVSEELADFNREYIADVLKQSEAYMILFTFYDNTGQYNEIDENVIKFLNNNKYKMPGHINFLFTEIARSLGTTQAADPETKATLKIGILSRQNIEIPASIRMLKCDNIAQIQNKGITLPLKSNLNGRMQNLAQTMKVYTGENPQPKPQPHTRIPNLDNNDNTNTNTIKLKLTKKKQEESNKRETPKMNACKGKEMPMQQKD